MQGGANQKEKDQEKGHSICQNCILRAETQTDFQCNSRDTFFISSFMSLLFLV